MSKKTEQSEAKKDIETFVQQPIKINTLEGDVITIKKVSWGKEIVILRVIESVIEDLAPIFNSPEPDAMKIAQVVLKKSPDLITELMATLLDQDEKWVMENLEAEEIIGVLIPLLRQRLSGIMAKIQPYLQDQALVNQVMAGGQRTLM